MSAMIDLDRAGGLLILPAPGCPFSNRLLKKSPRGSDHSGVGAFLSSRKMTIGIVTGSVSVSATKLNGKSNIQIRESQEQELLLDFLELNEWEIGFFVDTW